MEANTIKVKFKLISDNITKEPIIVVTDNKTSSGKWWANSLISIKSLITRDIIVPVLFSSKYETGNLCSLVNNSCLISAWIKTPTLCPYVATK